MKRYTSSQKNEAGFSLIEMLVAATVFTFVVTGVSGLFITAIDMQRRATGIQKVEENAQFTMESIAREIRVSTITSGDASCDPIDVVATRTLTLNHPTNGAVTYEYEPMTGAGRITRNGDAITSSDVDISLFAFCVVGSDTDATQSRVTMPMTLQSLAGRPSNRVKVSLQTTVVSRDLKTDLAQ